MSPATRNPQSAQEAITREAYLHARRIDLLSDPGFAAGCAKALEEEHQGLSVSLDELRRKYGSRGSISTRS